jgi:predicted nucleic acid-binding protein
MNQWLCDSHIISEEMRPKPNLRVQAWLKARDSIHLSVISIDEITFGLHQRCLWHRLRWFESFVRGNCIVLDIDTRIAQYAGRLRAELGQRGQTRSQADMLIAATAWANGLTLATRNTKDFEGTGITLFNPFE